MAFITTFEYNRDPVAVVREAARVGKHGLHLDDEPKFYKVFRRRIQQAFGKNPFYYRAFLYTFYLISIIETALQGRSYEIRWSCTGLPKWMPVQQWGLPVGDFLVCTLS